MDPVPACVVCLKIVLDTKEGLKCDGSCKRWFHHSCTGLSKADYLKISNNYANKWYCLRIDCSIGAPACHFKSVLETLVGKIDSLSKKLDKLKNVPDDVSTVKGDVVALKTKIEECEPRLVQAVSYIFKLETDYVKKSELDDLCNVNDPGLNE